MYLHSSCFISYGVYPYLDLQNIKNSNFNVKRIEENMNTYITSVGRPEGKRPLGRPRHMYVNIKMDLRDT
jgi:hypothetical protein